MKVLILAAGYGTRLYALSKDKPKALLPISGRPLLDYIIDKIRNIKNLNEIIIVTNNKFHTAFQQWTKTQTSLNCAVTIVNDRTNVPEERLGSIGDIDFTLKKVAVDDDLLVIGSDNLFDYNIDEYIDFAKEKSPAISIGLYDIGDLKLAEKFGVVAIDENNKIVSFEEKPRQPRCTLVAMCFYYLPKDSLGLIGKYLIESEKSDTAGDYIRWLHHKHSVYGFQFTGKWYDIGSVETYKQANENFA